MKSMTKTITTVVALAIAAALGIGIGSGLVNESSSLPTEPTEATEKIVIKEESKAEKLLEEMSLSDMVYQMMFVTPESITGVGTCVAAGETTKNALEKYPVGGIIYFAKNFETRQQTIDMIAKTQEFSPIPLFISVDEEGGRVARLGKNSSMGTTLLPEMRTIGDSNDPKKAYEAGVILAADLTQLGFNVDFAPIADVIVNEKNSEIGDRSFGTDAVKVSEMVGEITRGMEEGGLSATLKHFPGHGSTYANSHTGYSESTRTLDELRSTEFLPFKAGMENGADFVMVSHMTLVNATEEKVPSSVSREVITDFLLEELGFEGIVITDSFQMGAITDKYSVGEAAVKAVEAGVDMILMTPDVKTAHDAIVSRVESGEISYERIERSVRKILDIKEKKCILK